MGTCRGEGDANGLGFYHIEIEKLCEKCVKFGVALKRRVASARLRAMKGETGKTDSAPAFVLCPPGCADAVRRALPPGCDVVVAGSPEEARAAFAERTGAAAPAGGAGEVEIDGRSVDLTTLERAVFEVLSRAPGRTVSRAALLREIHGDAAGSVLPRVVDSTVSRLRRKLGPSGWRVETVWGRGYRWNAGDRPAARPFLQALRWSAGTLGVIFPPFVTILLIAYCLTNFFNTPAMINVFKGVRAGVCALILLSAIQLGKKILKGPFEIIMAVIGFLSLLVFNFNVILMIILAGVAGLVYKAIATQKKINN